MKLSTFAKEKGVSYKTVWRWWKSGIIKGKQMPSGTIILDKEFVVTNANDIKVVIYARVSSSQNKTNLESQADRLQQYSIAKGYQIHKVVKEIGSGLNDKRPKLLDVLNKEQFDILIIEHSDRLTRFGASYIESLLKLTNRKLEIINVIDNDEQDLIQDFVSVITSFCARIYGKRRTKRKTEKLIEELKKDE
ncbi:MAG: IS607 family transposase [Fusobacteriaceae bacterium]